MVSEYRALRASVIRLWTKAQGEITPTELEDLTRFNEAIDQSLAESISRFTQDLDHSKEMFLAILGHDLRTPLGAVMMSAEFMLETQELKEPHLNAHVANRQQFRPHEPYGRRSPGLHPEPSRRRHPDRACRHEHGEGRA